MQDGGPRGESGGLCDLSCLGIWRCSESRDRDACHRWALHTYWWIMRAEDWTQWHAHQAADPPCYVFIVNVKKNGNLYLSTCSQQISVFSAAQRQNFAVIPKLWTNTLPSCNLFTRHGYLQHAGAAYLGCFSQRNHLLLESHDVSLENAIFYRYNWSISIDRLGECSRANEAPDEASSSDGNESFAAFLTR